MEKWEIIFVFGKETSSSKKFHLLITFSSGVSLNNKFNLTKFRNITLHNGCMLLVSNCFTLILYRNLSNPPKLWTLRHFRSHASTTNNPCEELGTTGSTQFFAGFVRTAPWWPALTSRNSNQSQHGLYPVLYGPQFWPMSTDLS